MGNWFYTAYGLMSFAVGCFVGLIAGRMMKGE
jgi:hypothetical protein